MLPDFPEAKDRARRTFFNAVRNQIPKHEPILQNIHQSRIHEGRTARLTRADQSTDEIEFQKATAELLIKREQMRRITIEELLEQIRSMAEQFAGQQVQLMFSRISEAVKKVGNDVSAAEFGTMEAFLEAQRRLHVEFDQETLEPKNMVIVLHPDQAERFKSQMEEWNKDPAFMAEMTRIRHQQIEDWRARENRRKLVD